MVKMKGAAKDWGRIGVSMNVSVNLIEVKERFNYMVQVEKIE